MEKDDLVIARILYGGMIDRQGLLHVGDIIKEVNGKEVGSDPTELQEILKDCSGGITLKILPSYMDSAVAPQVSLAHRYPCLGVHLVGEEGHQGSFWLKAL